MATTYKRNNTFKPINDSTEITYTKGLAPSGSVNLAGVVTPTYGDLLRNATPSNSSMIPGVSYSSALNPNRVDPNKVTNTNIANPNLNSFSAPVVTTPKYEQVIKPYEGEVVTGESGESSEGGETGGEIVDTGSTGGERGSGATAPSYEEYILSMKSNADDAYKQSVLDAETARIKAVNDARNAYDKSVSGYGANAEALRSMGLVGSGYSDYLDSSAYAQMRDDVLAAHNTKQQAVSSAEALKAQQNAQYDGLYAEYLAQQERDKASEEASKRSTVAELIAKAGEYDSTTLSAALKQFGIEGEDAASITKASQDAIAKNFNGVDYDISDLDNARADIGEENYTRLLTDMIDDTYDTNITALYYKDEDGNVALKTKAEADAAYENLKTAYNRAVKEFGADNEKVKAYKAQVDAFKATIDSYYTVKTAPEGSVKFHHDRFGGDTGEQGNEIKVEVTNKGGKTEKYTLEYAGDGDTDTDNYSNEVGEDILSGIDDGTVFMYQNAMYVKVGGKAYKVVAKNQGKSKTASYEAVKKAIMGET